MLNEPEKRKSKKNPLTPAPVEAGDGARRQMDEFMMQLWEDRFKGQGEEIAELTRTLRGFNGTPGVMERLIGIETSVRLLAGKIDELIEAKPAPGLEEKKGFLTKDQLAAMALEFLKPVATAVIIWALLTFFPGVMAHVFKP